MNMGIAGLFRVDLWVQRKFRQETKVSMTGTDAYAQGGKLVLRFTNYHAPISGHPCRFDLYYGGRRIATSYEVKMVDFRRGACLDLYVTVDDWAMVAS